MSGRRDERGAVVETPVGTGSLLVAAVPPAAVRVLADRPGESAAMATAAGHQAAAAVMTWAGEASPAETNLLRTAPSRAAPPLEAAVAVGWAGARAAVAPQAPPRSPDPRFEVCVLAAQVAPGSAVRRVA